jgi:uroporphyrinogen-III synthase
MSDYDLKGRGILVTRAAHQAEGLSRRIEAGRGRAISFPALEIAACASPERARGLLLQAWDLIIFVSPNAVENALKLLSGNAFKGPLAAVGQATAATLRHHGYGIDLMPVDRYDSEGLLMLAPLQRMTGKRVLIVRGEGGRTLLADSLRARGAEVGYAEVYRRIAPKSDAEPLLARWRTQIDLVTVTSVEVLQNLISLLGERGWPLLSHTPLMVISERMRRDAEKRGFETILQSNGADDESIMTAIQAWIDDTT